jgi:hypothetical protein
MKHLLKIFLCVALSAAFTCFSTLASTSEFGKERNIFVHVTANLEIIDSSRVRLALDKFDKSRVSTLGNNFYFLSTNKWEDIWLEDLYTVTSHLGQKATFAWLDFNEMKFSEIVILSMKFSNDRKFVEYELLNPIYEKVDKIGFAALLFDPTDSGACALSVLEDAQLDGLNDALLAGAGVAALDCLLDDYVSVILNPAINHRVSPFYGFILKASVSD